MLILFQLLSSFVLFICLVAEFSPDKDDYNAYGLKVAVNRLMMVQANNKYSQFYIQFANFTNNVTESEKRLCSINYPASLEYGYPEASFYMYTVAVGKGQSPTPNIFFVGEMTGLDDSNPLANRAFIGVLSYTGSLTIINCSAFSNSIPLQFVTNTAAHQEHLVLVADLMGTLAYGFSSTFTFVYTAATDDLVVNSINLFSLSTAFLPFAIDYDGNYCIIVGLLRNNQTTRITYSAMVILFNIDASTAIATRLATWTYPSNSSTWQAGLTFTGAEKYDPKYDMSVSINPAATQVLVGIQVMNSVFLFNYANNTLILTTSISTGRGIGFGKGVGWLRDTLNSVAILANVYSTNYIWSSSNLFIYDSPLTRNSTPVSIFPNSQQLLYSYMSPVFINIIMSADGLLLLDDQGSFFMILSAPVGYFSSTTGPNGENFIAFSSYLPCTPGTFKNVTGIGQCRPCPTGTKNDGTNLAITTCIDCATNTFCPLGSVSDTISDDELNNIIQALAYPESPDISGIDDILFFTLFSIGSTGRCVALSPIFWTIIVAIIVILMTVIILIIRHYVNDQKAANSYKVFREVFKRTDLIRNGEMWTGGLATFCVLVLCISCIVFSNKYLYSYPIEEVGDSTYTCDTTIRNAQFSSSLQPLSIPVSDDMQEMIDLLNNQTIKLDVSFLNTINKCTASDIGTMKYLLGSTWSLISPTPTCSVSNYIVTYSAILPFRRVSIQITLPNTNIIGGLRITLSASGQNKSSTIMLQDLNFSKVLNQSERMLGHDASVALRLSKVINKTSPLVTGNDDVYSGIWAGLFTVNYYESFMTDTEYLNATARTSRSLTLTISETSYYILNEQSPIARLPEIVFHDFLFITMIIGMCALMFVIVEVLILPCITFIIRRNKGKANDKQLNSSHQPSASNDASNFLSAQSPITHDNQEKNIVDTIDNSGPHDEQLPTSIQSAIHKSDGNHQLPQIWKREPYV